MRTFFTFLLFFAVSSFSYAQLTLSTTDTLIPTANASIGLDYGSIILTNTGSEDIEIAVTLERECYAHGDLTAVALCMGSLCFLPTSNTTTWRADLGEEPVVVLEPNVPSNALKFTPAEADTFTSVWNVIFFDRNNPDVNAVLHIEVGDGVCVDAPPVSVTEFVHEIGKAFPNPAIDRISIPFSHNANDAQLVVFNALGIRMDVVQIDQYVGQIDLDVSQYNKGIYFYYLVDEKNGQSRMLSFVK